MGNLLWKSSLPPTDAKDTIDEWMSVAGMADGTKLDDPLLLDQYITSRQISSVGVRSTATNRTALHYASHARKQLILQYILTSDFPPNVDEQTTDGYQDTPLHYAVEGNNTEAAMILINFNASRNFKNDSGQTPLSFAISKGAPDDLIELLSDYHPTEEEKVSAQIESKELLDSHFQAVSKPRFKQAKIDMKYISMHAVLSGDLNILKQSIVHVDMQRAVSLAIVAAQKDHLHLLDCLCSKIRGKAKQAARFNRAGISISLGKELNGEDGRFNYYCGRRLGKDFIPGSDGQCGPNNGPQCPDCEGVASNSRFNKAGYWMRRYEDPSNLALAQQQRQQQSESTTTTTTMTTATNTTTTKIAAEITSTDIQPPSATSTGLSVSGLGQGAGAGLFYCGRKVGVMPSTTGGGCVREGCCCQPAGIGVQCPDCEEASEEYELEISRSDNCSKTADGGICTLASVSNLNARNATGETLFDCLTRMTTTQKVAATGRFMMSDVQKTTTFSYPSEEQLETLITSLLCIGLDPTDKQFGVSKSKSSRNIPPHLRPFFTTTSLSPTIEECIHTSRVLCVLKLMYHKLIFLGMDTTYDIVQTLMLEIL